MKVRVHYSLIIVLVLSLFTRQFIPFTIFFTSIILHELSHLFMAKLFGQQITSLTLTALGGIVEIKIRKISAFKLLIIQCSGILMNLVIYFLVSKLPAFSYQDIIVNFNLILILFNILPIYPLDGHLILKTLISSFCSFSKEFFITSLVSWLGIICFTFYSIKIMSLALIIISVFLIHKNIFLLVYKDYFLLQKIIMTA